MAAAHDAVRLGGGGLVEGACGGGTPVNEQGSAVLVGQGEPTHVAGRMVGHVEAAKHQTIFDAFEARSHFAQVSGQGLALGPSLSVADAVGRVDAPLTLPIQGAQRVQSLVGVVHEILFGQRKVGRRLAVLARGHGSSSIMGLPLFLTFVSRALLCAVCARLRRKLKTVSRVTRWASPGYVRHEAEESV